MLEKNGNRIILDAYNANPSSMDAAIDNFSQLDAPSKMAILGDMFELGPESLYEHKQLANKLAGNANIEVFLIGKDFYANATEHSHLRFFETYDDFSEYFRTAKPADKTILIKGSRGMALERVLELI